MDKFLLVFLVLFVSITGCDDGMETTDPSGEGIVVLSINKSGEKVDSSIKVILTTKNYQRNLILGEPDFLDTLFNVSDGTWTLRLELDNGDEFNGKEYIIDLDYDLIVNNDYKFISDEYSININFYWQKTSKWMNFSENPVMKPLNNNFDYGGIAQSYIVMDKNIFHLFYVGVINNGVKYLLSSQSTDGINWSRDYDSPALSPGQNGEWDSWAVHPGPIILINGIYHMYYTGFASIWGNWEVGLATSKDLIKWNKKPGPVLSEKNGWSSKIIPWSIVKKDDLYLLYYTIREDYDHPEIGLAISSDGLNWENFDKNPILSYNYEWEEEGIHYPSVKFENGVFKMAYATLYSSAFGWATSSDGFNWTKSSEPFFTKREINSWADEIAYPFLLDIESQNRCYLTGYKYNSDKTYSSSIGFIY